MATSKDKIRASAQKYLQKGQIDKAIREYYRLVEIDPKDVRTLLKIGDLQTRSKQFDDATETYGKVARFYSEQGFFLKAVAVYKQILKLQPTLVDINKKLAELYHQLGLVSDATNQYRQISQIYEKQGKLDEAAEILQRMVELDPDNVPGRIKLAEIYARTGKTEEARADFHKAAAFLKSQHRIDDYAKVAERIIHFDPSDLDTARELADIYIQQGDARRALAKLQVCFRADPKNIETLTLLAEAFRELGQTNKTLSVLRELMRTHQEAGQDAAAQRAARKILQLAPSDEDALALAGDSADLDDEPEAAAAASESVIGRIVSRQRPVQSEVTEIDPQAAISEEPEEAPAVPDEVAAEAMNEQLTKLLVETDIYIKYGLRAKALEHLKKIFSINPTLREARSKHKDLLLEDGDTEGAVAELFAMATTARENGDVSDAARDLDELLELQPDNKDAQDLLGQLPAEVVAAVAPNDAEAVPSEANVSAKVEVETDLDVADLDFVEVELEVDEEGREPIDRDAIDPEIEAEVEPEVETEIGVDEEGREPIDVEVELEVDEEGKRSDDALEVEVELPEMEAEEAPEVEIELPDVDEEGRDDAMFEPTVDLEEELGEVSFFIEQGLVDEARDNLKRLLTSYPDNPEVLALQAKLTAGVGADIEDIEDIETEPEMSTDAEPEPDVEIAELDFATDLTEELDQAIGDGDFQMSFTDVFDEFKKGVAEQVDDTDYDTHYDLGIAYREMGLLSDAIREFTLSKSSPEKEISALTMLGLCWLQQGNAEEALRSFQMGLTSKNVTPAGAVALRYEIASAYEGMGRLGEALKFYQKAAALDASFRDVATRVVEISKRTTREAKAAVSTELDDLLDETSAEVAAQDKISYV